MFVYVLATAFLEGEPLVEMSDYLHSSRFWFEAFQNWQSEFLAIGGDGPAHHLAARSELA